MVLMVLSFAIDIAGSGDTLSSDSQNVGEWRMTSRDLQRTAHYPGPAPSNFSNLTAITKTGLSLSSAQAAVAGGYMYIADNSYLYKVNAYNVSQQIDRSGSISTLYITGPTIWNDFVYVTSGSTYYQFNASNLTQTTNTFSVGSQSWNNPIVYNNRIYFASTSTDLLYEANASNISKIISNTSKTNCDSNIAIDNSFMYIACGSTLFQLNMSNLSQTYASYGVGQVNNRGGVTIGGGYAYVTETSTDRVWQLNASNISKLVNYYTLGGDAQAAVAYANGYVYAGAWDGYLYQLNASNVSQLITSLNTGTVYYTPIANDNYVFVVAGSGITYQLNATNISQIIGQVSTGGNFNSPTLANGIFYTHSGSVMYQYGSGAPIVTLNSPADSYSNQIQTATVTFNCSATSGIGLANISLHLTDSSNQNLSLNQSTIFSGSSNSSSWELNLANGTYSWNCLSYDTSNFYSWGTSRTLTIGDIYAPTFTFNSPTPANNLAQRQNHVEINVSIEEYNLDELRYNWNGTNYTQYNGSLILMFNFENVSSLGENDTYVVDMGNNKNNGTIAGASSNNLGKRGRAISFDGIDDSINISDDEFDISPGENFTFISWIKTDFKSNYPRIFNKREINAPNKGYECYIDQTGGFLACNLDTGPSNPGVSSTIDLTDNSWHHIAVVLGGTNAIIYVDGIINGNNTNVALDDGYDNNVSFTIGSPTYTGTFFNGSIDEVRIWNRSLSADEIYQQYVSNLKKIDNHSWEFYVNQSRNSTNGLTEGNYSYYVYANDDYNQASSSAERIVIVDTTSPIFTNISNRSVEWGFSLSYDINATDTNGLSCFTVNDTTRFNIDCSGILQNNTYLTTGLYDLLIAVNDTAGNNNQQTMWVNVTPDITLPTFTYLANKTVEYGTSLSHDLNASDNNLFSVLRV